MTVAQAIDEGVLDEDFFEDTDNRQELIRKVTCYHRVNTDLEIFTSKLGTMCLKDQNIIRPYLLREKSMDDLAVDLGIDYCNLDSTNKVEFVQSTNFEIKIERNEFWAYFNKLQRLLKL